MYKFWINKSVPDPERKNVVTSVNSGYLGYEPIILLKLKSHIRYLAAHDEPPVTEESVLPGKDFPLLLRFHGRLAENQTSQFKPDAKSASDQDSCEILLQIHNITSGSEMKSSCFSDPDLVALNMAKNKTFWHWSSSLLTFQKFFWTC